MRNCSLLIIVLLSSLSLTPSDVHDLHLTKTDIIYNTESKSIEITMNLFIDDLEKAISLMGSNHLNLCTSKESEDAEDYIAQYLENHFKIFSGGTLLNWDFVGKESSDDILAVWCYLEIVQPNLKGNISIEVDLFNELYEDQRNVVKLVYDKTHKDYFLLDNKKVKGSISIN
jgi:hypothetical protein